MMGGKDAAKAYRVGLTTEALNVRTGPGTSNKAVYRYNKGLTPVIIVGEVKPSPWIKVISDAMNYDELYVSGDFVKEIPMVK